MASKTVFTGNPKSKPTTEKVFTIVKEQTPQRPGKVLTREAQNPKQTPRKVGKPTIEQLTWQVQALDTIRDLEPDKTARTRQNMLYQAIGEKFIADHADEIPGAERLCKGRGCLEQLGRMIDTVDDTTVLDAAKNAADALTAGRTVKQVETYLRHGRTTGEWDESLLNATREAASNTAKPVDGLTLDDLRAIEWILDIEIQVYVKDIEAFSHMDDKDEAIIALGNRARFIEYYQKKLQAAIKSAGGELQR